MARYEIEVPGRFVPGVAFLDLETVKVAAGIMMPNGERLARRWSIALAGIACDGVTVIVDPEGKELDGLAEIGDQLVGSTAVVYGATREFDEMICRGRFTNARRKHLPTPIFPAVPGAEDLVWRNIGTAKTAERAADIPSREVPAGLVDGRRDLVMIHLLRDVADLILSAGDPDGECEAWCRMVLIDSEFAISCLSEG